MGTPVSEKAKPGLPMSACDLGVGHEKSASILHCVNARPPVSSMKLTLKLWCTLDASVPTACFARDGAHTEGMG